MKTKIKKGEFYIGQDNNEEVEIVVPKKMQRDITRLAKRAGITEVELLAQYMNNISLPALAGLAEGIRLNIRDEKSAPRRP